MAGWTRRPRRWPPCSTACASSTCPTTSGRCSSARRCSRRPRAGVRAFALYLNGRYGDAARAYREAHRGPVRASDTGDPTGAWAAAVGDTALAERRARTALEAFPTALEPRVTLAEVALDRGGLAEASRELSAVLAAHSDHIEALYLSAVVHGRAGRAGEAIDALNRALRSGYAGARRATPFRLLELAGDLHAGPAAERPLCLLAHLFRYLRIFDGAHAARALAYAELPVAANDRPADAWLTIAVVQDKLGRHEAAMQAVRHALAADPRHAEAYRWAAVEARQRGDLLLQYRMIRKAFESALTDPYYVEDLSRVVLGTVLMALWAVICVQRVMTATPPAWMRRLLEDGELVVGFVVLNLILMNVFSPFLMLLSQIWLGASLFPLVLGMAARLSGRVLFVTFVVATIALLWLSLTRLARHVAPASVALRRVQRAFRVVATSAVALYGIYATALSFNGSLDGPLAVEHRRELVAVTTVNTPLDFPVSWIDLRAADGTLERITLIAGKDGVWAGYVDPGQAVVVRVRAGFFGIPWIESVALDEERRTELLVEAAPSAAEPRRALVALRLRQGRAADAGTHTRGYPGQSPRDTPRARPGT